MQWDEYLTLLKKLQNKPGPELAMRLEHEPVCCWLQIVFQHDNYRYLTAEMFGQYTVDEWVTKISQNYVTSLQNKACKKWQDVFKTNKAMF